MLEKNHIFNIPISLVKRCYQNKNELPSYRTEFMRDRDRLMYATAFRRLSGKTQIYTVGSDDHRKNRLTHTLEVAQIARTIAIALNLNPDLAEAIALGHDFGHTPFGHAGERILHDILIPDSPYIKKSPFYNKSYSEIVKRFARENPTKKDSLSHLIGFKHNIQSVRVAALLEDSYRNDANRNIGLNLTNFTLYGMMIHSNLQYKDSPEAPNFQNFFKEQMNFKNYNKEAWSFEAYIVSLADDIAQWHHDLEDAIREGVLSSKKICDTIKESLGTTLDPLSVKQLDDMSSEPRLERNHIANLSHIVVNTLVTDLINTSTQNLEELNDTLNKDGIDDSEEFFKNYDFSDFRINRNKVISFSANIDEDKFKKTIKSSIHHSRNVERMNEKGKYIIRKLFEAYYAHPQQLPDGPILHFMVDIERPGYENIDQAKKAVIGEAREEFDEILKNPTIYERCMLMRRICDHIASMTDHYAIEEYNNLYG